MAEHLDNPAGRLHALLLELHRRHSQSPQGALAWDALAAITVPQYGASSPEAVVALAQVLALPMEIRDAVAAFTVDDVDEMEHLLEHLDEVESALALMTNRGQNLQQFFIKFAPGCDVPRSAAVGRLSTCSRALRSYRPEPVISAEDLSRIEQAITSLMSDVAEMELEPDARILLLRHLHAMLRAVHQVRITGCAPLEESLDAFVGALVRQPTAVAQLEDRGVLPRLTKLGQMINAAVAVANGAFELGNKVLALVHRS
ncbi:hypothetical protein K7472_24920 [Streptomyces sp. PTM05]|uniref:Uncharacterized protein n=1 Tax=Streptantibioticus parmotrematis TaxID=2873249 RepID=A0ABS7QXX6_9ACTN|nr:hypothetical protein [Streptantibioticus parmotrematis]MBY8888058.1 hypothetical protein [Streptantibioticus parmotrematis]